MPPRGNTLATTKTRGRRVAADGTQRRYWEHRIRDENDFRRHVDYTHFNPVKHGYVSKVADWRLSSFHDHVKRGWIDVDWGTTEPENIGGLEAGE